MPSAAATSGPAATVAEEMASSDSDVCLSDASCDVPPLPCTTVEHRKVRVSLAVRDLSLLEPGLPFNDTVTDYFMVTMRKRWQFQSDDNFVCTAFWYPSTLRKVADSRLVLFDGKDLFEYKQVLIPVNYAAHWVLVVLETFPNGRVVIYYFDSASSVDEPLKERIEIETRFQEFALRAVYTVFGLAHQLAGAQDVVITVQVEVPQQLPASNDCGPMTLYFAFKVLACGVQQAMELLKEERERASSGFQFGALSRMLLKLLLACRNVGDDSDWLVESKALPTPFQDGVLQSIGDAFLRGAPPRVFVRIPLAALSGGRDSGAVAVTSSSDSSQDTASDEPDEWIDVVN